MTREKKELKEMAERNKDFHYMITDRRSGDIDYYIRIESEDNAKKAIETVEFLLHLFDSKDIPEWYDFKKLEDDKARFNEVFGKA